MEHFVAIAGLHGCMPNCCAAYDTYDGAVEDMVQLHDLGKGRARQLKRNGYLELNLHRDGNEYIEIGSCDCDDPDCHND